MEEKRNHSNDPNATQPIDDMGRYTTDGGSNDSDKHLTEEEKMSAMSNQELLDAYKGKRKEYEGWRNSQDGSDGAFWDAEIAPLWREAKKRGLDLDTGEVTESKPQEPDLGEISDEDLLEFENELDDEWEKPQDALMYPKRKDFDPKNPAKGFQTINSDMLRGSYTQSGKRKWGQNCQRCYCCFELWCRGYDVKAAPLPSDDKDLSQGYIFDDKDTQAAYDEMVRKSYGKRGIPDVQNLSLSDTLRLFVMRAGEGEGKASRRFLHPFKGLAKEMSDFQTQFSSTLYNQESQPNKAFGMMEEYAKKGGVGSRYAIQVIWNSGSGHIFNAIYDDSGLKFYDSQTGEVFDKTQMEQFVLRCCNCSTIQFGRTDDKEIDYTYIDESVRKK